MAYYLTRSLDITFEEAIPRVTEELKKEGFGIVTEIDLTETFRKKLGVEFRKYRILGACNPSIAYQALLAEDKIGTMLPCNVIVQERADGGVEVSTINPALSMKAVENPELEKAAAIIATRLSAVLEGL